MSDNTDDLIISISTDQATLRRSIQNIDRSLQGLASTVKKQFADAGSAMDKSIATTMQNRINAMVGIGTKAANEWNGVLADQGKELERLRAKYSPLFNTINNYKIAVADIRRAHTLGAISTDEMTSAIARERQAALASTAAIKGRNQALQATVITSGGRGGANNFQTSNLAAQGFDIASTAAFMPWYTVALQQGPQVAQVFNDIKASGSAIGPAVAGAFAQILNPVSLVTMATIAGTAALIQYVAKSSEVKTADDILKGHAETVGLLKERYGEAAKGLREYVNEGLNGTAVDIRTRLEEARKAVSDAAKNRSTYSSFIDPLARSADPKIVSDYRQAFVDLRASIREGEPELLRFRDAMARIAESSDAPEEVKKLAREMREFDPEIVKVAKSIPTMVDQLSLIEGTADRQAIAIGRLTAALLDLNKIGVPALTDSQKVEDAYQRAISNASTREERDDAYAAKRDALKRLDDQDPTIFNSDGKQTAVPVPAEKPITLGDKPSAEGRKAETAAQRAANAYRDLKKAADDRIGQVQQEIELLGRFGVEADAARFALDLFQQAEDKGRSLSPEQRAEIEKKVALYKQYSETLAEAKLQQDLLNERRFNSLSREDQQVITTQRQNGLPEDLGSREADQIRQNMRMGDAREEMKTFTNDFKNALLNNGGDIGKAFGEAIQNALMAQASKLWDKVFDQLINAVLGSSGGAAGAAGGGGAFGAVLGAVTGGGSSGGRSSGGVVDLASGLVGQNENRNASSINAFLKRGGVDIDAAQTAWCAAFVNSSLSQVGLKGTGSLTANSFQKWGKSVDLSDVMRGDVLLQSRGLGAGQAGGHVGLATGASRMGRNGMQWQMLSGNSSDSVATTWVDAAQLQARRATEAADALGKVADSSGMATKGLGALGQLSAGGFPSAPAAGGGGGGIFSWLSGLFNGGGMSDAVRAKHLPLKGLFANGTNYSPGGLALVGEQGPEILNLPQGSQVVPNGKTKALLAPKAPSLAPRSSMQTIRNETALTVHVVGASGDEHIRMLVNQGVGEALSQQNENMRRGGFGTIQTQFANQKG